MQTNKSGILVLVTLTILAMGCASHSGSSTVAQPETQPALVGLPAPSDVPRQASVADSARIRQGNQYIPTTNHNTSDAGFNTENFEPSWSAGNEALDNTAFAIYGFPLDDYAGDPQITIRWVGAPPPDENVWVGLPNYAVDGWNWIAYPAGGYIEYDPAGPHFNGDGDLMVALVVTGSTTYRFDYIRIGPDVAPVAGLEADVYSGNATLAVIFDASASYDPDGAIDKYELDPLGDGSWIDNGSNRFFPVYNYATPGSYTAVLRVTDSEMNTATTEVAIGVGWQHSWGGAGFDSGDCCALDADGNLYVLGLTTNFGEGANELLLLKYDTLGNILWQKTFGDSSGDDPGGIGLDNLGNVYIAGSDLDNGDFSNDPFIISLTPAGVERWQKTWTLAGSTEVIDLVVDSLGDVYLLCNYDAPFPSTVDDVVLLKYDGETGSLLMQKFWDGGFSERATELAIDASNNLYVGVTSNSYSVGNLIDNPLLVSITPAGVERFVRKLAIEDENGRVGVSEDNGGVFLTNVSVVVKSDTNGVLEWQRNVLGDGNTYSLLHTVGGPGGGCFVTATFTTPADGALQAALLRLDTTGELVFSRSFGQANEHDGFSGMLLGDDGGIYLTGRAIDNAGAWAGYTASSSAVDLPWEIQAGTVSNASGVNSDWGGVLANVAPGAETVDTGGGGDDLQAMRFFP